MHFYDGHFGGMHIIWWIIWLVFLAWIFFTPFDIPFNKSENETPLNLLKKRLAKGEISKEEFEELKKILNSDK
jgi:putative membrane protein